MTTTEPISHDSPRWRRYLRLWGARIQEDVDDELEFHREMRIAEYRAQGLSEAAAIAAADARIGSLAGPRAECIRIDHRRERRMTRAQTLDALVHDVRFAIRSLGRQRGWTAVAVLTLTLGVGANTAVFSVVNSILLHPLPFPEPARTVLLYERLKDAGGAGNILIGPRIETIKAWQDHSPSFEEIQAFATTDQTITTAENAPAVVHSAAIQTGFLKFAGMAPLLGRAFGAEDVAPGAARVVMLSEGTWRSRYGGDPAIIGRSIQLDGNPYLVIGVMPRALQIPGSVPNPDTWLPLQLRKSVAGEILNTAAVGRLRPGVALDAARRELDSVLVRAQLGATPDGQFAAHVARPDELVNFRSALLTLAVAVALVLLIACSNVAHLLLARGSARARELAIRTALGAGRARVVRLLITESLVLAMAGCAGGLALGWFGLRTLLAARPDGLAELDGARMDLRVLGATVLLSTATGLAFGILGAVQATRGSSSESLKAGTLNSSGARSHHRLRGALVVTEIAIATVLLVGATLLVRSVSHLEQTDPGFQPKGLYAVGVVLPPASYPTAAAQQAFTDQLLARAQSLDGVRAITQAQSAPPQSSAMLGKIEVEHGGSTRGSDAPFLRFNSVRSDYFTTLAMSFVAGATFTDTTKAASQVIINAGLAAHYWPRANAMGQRLRLGPQAPWLTVVGIVSDVASAGMIADRSEPVLYLPGPTLLARPTILVRTSGDANPMAAMRGLVTAIDPHLPPATIVSVADEMTKTIARPRFTMLLLTVFTALALVLSAVGLYGVMAYAVSQRTREIGIRLALGATRARVAGDVLGRGLGLALLGVGAGLLAASWGTRAIEALLYGIPRTDVASFVVGGLVLLTTAVMACVVPVRRAVAVDPVIAMRAD